MPKVVASAEGLVGLAACAWPRPSIRPSTKALLVKVTGMVEILSQRFSKTSLLTTERRECYRNTDINLFKTVFSALLCGSLQYSWPRQFPRQRETRSPALRVNHRSPVPLRPFVRFIMRITSQLICQAADQLKGFVGLNRKTGQYIVRFSEDSFGMDVADDGIIPTSEFVWAPGPEQAMTLKRELIQLLLDQNIDERINITEPLRVYMNRREVPEISAVRSLVQG